MARITYADKEQHHASPLPDEQKWMHGDANEVKDSVNAVYDADAAATGEVMFNDGTGVGKSPDLLFDGILQVGAISDVGQLQLGGATDTAVGTVSSNGTLTVEGQTVEVSGATEVALSTGGTKRFAVGSDGEYLVQGDEGTEGQFIKSNGPGAAASWADILASGIANTPFFYLQSGSVTGTYREDGENGGRPKFSLITGNPALDLSAWSGTFWGVTIGGVLAYRSFDDVANPTLCTTWEAVSGAEPLPTTSPLYGPTVQDALQQLAARVSGLLEYEALLNQTGTSAPVLSVLVNTTGATVSASRDGDGTYFIYGPFISGKTSVYMGQPVDPNNGWEAQAACVSDGIIGLQTYANGIHSDDTMPTGQSILIRTRV